MHPTSPLHQTELLSCTTALLAAIILFAAITPGILMTAPAIAAQLAVEWQLPPSQIGRLFSIELGAMSLATLPAWWWLGRINWRTIARLAVIIFVLGNLASAIVSDFNLLLLLRFVTSLAGGTLMILCITCAAKTANPGRVYAFWVLGQLVVGMIGLLILPVLFTQVGLMAVYLILAALMLCGLPLSSSFPSSINQTQQVTSPDSLTPYSSTLLKGKLFAVLAVLAFYISLSAVWTFIGNIATQAGLSSVKSGQVLAAATLFGIIGAGIAAIISTQRHHSLLLWAGYLLLFTSILLLRHDPLLIRFALAAIMFKFTWTFVMPFILARVAGLDNDGKLMNNINLVIGGGMAIGPAMAGYLFEYTRDQ